MSEAGPFAEAIRQAQSDLDRAAADYLAAVQAGAQAAAVERLGQRHAAAYRRRADLRHMKVRHMLDRNRS